MWVKWFEYTTLKTMDEDLAEEACILRRLWPGSIEKEKQRMNAVSLRKKKERRWKLETLRRLSNRMFLRSISSRRKDLRNRQGSSDDFKLMHPSGMILPGYFGVPLQQNFWHLYRDLFHWLPANI
ncbi:unnamed protein product [Brassica rapa subsp. narinosa]